MFNIWGSILMRSWNEYCRVVLNRLGLAYCMYTGCHSLKIGLCSSCSVANVRQMTQLKDIQSSQRLRVGAHVILYNLCSIIDVRSSATHLSAERQILFKKSKTPEELFHQTRDVQSVQGRRKLKMSYQATGKLMLQWQCQRDQIKSRVWSPVAIFIPI